MRPRSGQPRAMGSAHRDVVLLEIGAGLEAQMIRNMRRGSPPRLMAPQPSCVPASGNPIRLHQPETVLLQSHATEPFSQSKSSFSTYALLGRVDGFDDDEAKSECDEGSEVLVRFPPG